MFTKIRKMMANQAYSEEGAKLTPTNQARVQSLEAEYKLLGEKRKDLFRQLAKDQGLKGENDIKIQPRQDGLYLLATKVKPNEKTKPADSGNNKSDKQPGTNPANAEGKARGQDNGNQGVPTGAKPNEAPNPPSPGEDRKTE